MVVPNLCHVCSRPTTLACRMCGRPVCDAHRTSGPMVVCLDCAHGHRGGTPPRT